MRSEGAHRACTVFLHEVSSLADSASGVHHVVDNHYVFVLHFANDCHAFNHVSFGALFVAEHQRSAKEFSIAVGTLCATNVGRSNNQVLELQRLDVGNKHRRSIEVVNRDVEETLNLVGVEVHGDDSVYAGSHKQVGNQFCGNRNAWFVLAVLTSPSEVRDNGNNRLCRCALGGINHEQKLHKVVAVWESGLNNEHFVATDWFFEAHFKLAVGKVLNVHFA